MDPSGGRAKSFGHGSFSTIGAWFVFPVVEILRSISRAATTVYVHFSTQSGDERSNPLFQNSEICIVNKWCQLTFRGDHFAPTERFYAGTHHRGNLVGSTRVRDLAQKAYLLVVEQAQEYRRVPDGEASVTFTFTFSSGTRNTTRSKESSKTSP